MKLCFASDRNVEVVSIESGKDAADMARENPEELKSSVKNSKNAMEYLLEDSLQKYDKNDVSGKRKISELMVDMIGSVASAVEKSHWIKRIAEKLETTEAALTDALKKATLRNRAGKERKEEAVFSARPKIDILFDELLGIILAYPDVWKEAVKGRQTRSFGPKDSLLKIVLESGESVGYNKEKLISLLAPAHIERAEDLYFQKKFRMGLNNELEEIIAENPQKEFESISAEIEKEIRKDQLEKIAIDLKAAEEKKDRPTINFLRSEFKRISDQSQKIL
jgi:DNA primase